jgi:hypothetical protein
MEAEWKNCNEDRRTSSVAASGTSNDVTSAHETDGDAGEHARNRVNLKRACSADALRRNAERSRRSRRLPR